MLQASTELAAALLKIKMRVKAFCDQHQISLWGKGPRTPPLARAPGNSTRDFRGLPELFASLKQFCIRGIVECVFISLRADSLSKRIYSKQTAGPALIPRLVGPGRCDVPTPRPVRQSRHLVDGADYGSRQVI